MSVSTVMEFLIFLCDYQVPKNVLNAKALALILWITSMGSLKLVDYVGFAGMLIKRVSLSFFLLC